MKKKILLSLFCAILCGIFGRADNLRWLSTDYDFGTWSEKQGPRTGSVRCVNDGETPSFIRRVRPSCGCTGADFFKGPIMPGDTAWVSFTYNPAGRPGEFEKTVKVYTGEDSHLTTIIIRGTIIGRPESLEGKYPFESGALRLSSIDVDFGKVPLHRLRHDFIRAYNQTGDTISPAVVDVQGPLTVTMSANPVLPGRYFSIGICLDTNGDVEPGEHEYSFRIVSDSKNPGEGLDVRVRTEIESPVVSLTKEELASAPVVNVSSSVIDVRIGKKREGKFRFKITNTGKSTLLVKRISASPNSGVSIKKWPVHLLAGKSEWVEGNVILPEGENILSTDLRIFTNDPLRPEVKLRVAGTMQHTK